MLKYTCNTSADIVDANGCAMATADTVSARRSHSLAPRFGDDVVTIARKKCDVMVRRLFVTENFFTVWKNVRTFNTTTCKLAVF